MLIYNSAKVIVSVMIAIKIFVGIIQAVIGRNEAIFKLCKSGSRNLLRNVQIKILSPLDVLCSPLASGSFLAMTI
jgi:hypothetical protein